ncbi:hypothetical protein OUZ56_026915 [Daphnia magna]|uniref:Uncharacterized protein n=1 Tax=Daphnia magna TaxID=35525 RepID=A0ABQ9ZN72_9CRUS|nr:hypothetical protein OUZ56_026915 [Daphnia magna]
MVGAGDGMEQDFSLADGWKSLRAQYRWTAPWLEKHHSDKQKEDDIKHSGSYDVLFQRTLLSCSLQPGMLARQETLRMDTKYVITIGISETSVGIIKKWLSFLSHWVSQLKQGPQ